MLLPENPSDPSKEYQLGVLKHATITYSELFGSQGKNMI